MSSRKADGTVKAADAVRLCPYCGKRLARLNPGVVCWACAEVHESPPPKARRPRTALPHDTILELFREIGDTTEVARRLGLARSSVWYAVRRARETGELSDEASRPTV
jgi:hypothetical protein